MAKRNKRTRRNKSKTPSPVTPEAVSDKASASPEFSSRGLWRSLCDPHDRRQVFLWILCIFLVSRIVLSVSGVLAREWLGVFTDSGYPPVVGLSGLGAWLDIWAAWDAGWYYDIAVHGYSAVAKYNSTQINMVFFPLYPWLARYAGVVFGNAYLGGLVVSNIALIFAAYFLYRLMETMHDRACARRVVLMLFLFPTGYAFSAFMSEGLFLALTIGAWSSARRGNWWLASLFGGLSAMTRLVGVLIAPLLVVEYLRQRQWRAPYRFGLMWRQFIYRDAGRHLDWRFLWLALVPLGLGVFMLVCWRITGNPLEFLGAQRAWANTGINPISSIVNALSAVTDPGLFNPRQNLAFAQVTGAVFSIAALIVLTAGIRHIGMPLYVWSLVMFLVPLSGSGILMSMPRYAAVVFSLYLILAVWSSHRAWLWVMAAVMAMLQLPLWMLWTTVHLVAV